MYFLITFGGCSMLNSSVASFPAKSMMAFFPPGWSGKKLVRSYTLPSMMHQQSPSALCFVISSSVNVLAPPPPPGAGAFAAIGGGAGRAAPWLTAAAGGENIAPPPPPPPPAASSWTLMCTPCFPPSMGSTAMRMLGFTCAWMFDTRFRAASVDSGPPARSVFRADDKRCLDTESPATRPKTTQSRSELPPRRFLPWIPPATSPAAYRPTTGMPRSFTTCDSALMARPPMV